MTDDPLDELPPLVPDSFDVAPLGDRSDTGGESDITDNREEHFDIGSGRFHDPDTGEFERGGPPPDYDADVDRYRAEDGRFKDRSADLFDEPAEVRMDSLEPEG